MELVESSGTAAVTYLRRDPIGNVFPIYAALRSHACPVGLLAVGPNGETCGVLVDASRCSTETVRDIYIDSTDENVVVQLFNAAQPRIVKKVKQGIYIPSQLLTAEESCFVRCQLSRERIYRLERTIPVSDHASSIREVTAEYLATLVISSAFDPYLGKPVNLPSEGRFYGLVQNGVLLAIAECIVDTGDVAAVEQVFVSPLRRREQLGTSIVKQICNLLLNEGKTVVYRVEENNLPSLRLAESLGFTLHLSLGYVL